MTNSKNGESYVVDNYLGSSSTCTNKIARIFTTIAAFSFISSISSAIAASGMYILDHNIEAECSAAALSSFSIVTSIVGTISLISAVGISYGLCGNYDVYNSSVSSIPPTPSIAVEPSSRGVSSSSLSPCNISSNISSQRSSTDFSISYSLEFLELMETSL